jgi:hypothetical protein
MQLHTSNVAYEAKLHTQFLILLQDPKLVASLHSPLNGYADSPMRHALAMQPGGLIPIWTAVQLAFPSTTYEVAA